jgi:hypothetical protein
MGSCFKKKKPNTTKTVKNKRSGSVTAKSSGYFPELTTSAGPESDKRTGKEKFDANPARAASVARKKKKQKKAKQAALREATTTPTTTTTTTTPTTTTTTTPTTTTTLAPANDTVTTSGGTIGGTSVTAESIYTRDPEEAISDQERLAAEELRRQRIKRARTKQSLLRKRLERTQEVGSGRRVLSGSERDLNVQTRQSGSGKRGGAGRRSLITGSTGGIGYYSRFL